MLCCGLGPTFGALERMRTEAADIVLITGLGPVGLGGIINCVSRGNRVLAVTNNPYRAHLAEELGAEKVFPSNNNTLSHIIDYTDGKGVDQAMECAGHKDPQRLLVNATRRNGKIAFIGESGDFNFLVSEDLIRKGLTFFGIWHYNYQGIAHLFEVVRNNKDKIAKMITHYFPMEQVTDAWELQMTKKCGKVILQPW
jgi:threonine dehydrogenase-like Zn-dependent dehydrogenase